MGSIRTVGSIWVNHNCGIINIPWWHSDWPVGLLLQTSMICDPHNLQKAAIWMLTYLGPRHHLRLARATHQGRNEGNGSQGNEKKPWTISLKTTLGHGQTKTKRIASKISDKECDSSNYIHWYGHIRKETVPSLHAPFCCSLVAGRLLLI